MVVTAHRIEVRAQSSNAGVSPVPFGFGVMEVLLIVVLGLFLFGARRIPLIARGLGQGIREFKKEVTASPEEDQPRVGDGGGDGEG